MQMESVRETEGEQANGGSVEETRWQQITAVQQLDQALGELRGAQIALVQFKAPWCKKCSTVAAELKEQIADDVVWLTVDIDELEELALRYNVSKMPRADVYADGHAKRSLEAHAFSTQAILRAIEDAAKPRPDLQLDADF